jgi:hypothetical protein
MFWLGYRDIGFATGAAFQDTTLIALFGKTENRVRSYFHPVRPLYL